MTHKSIEKVAVVVPNLNGEAYLGEAIDSLLAQTFKSAVIVVENASTDNSQAILDLYGSRITVLKNSKNLGFAGGVNTGISYALTQGFDAIALFNNDAVADKNWLKELVSVMKKDHTVGVVTGKIELTGNKLLDSTGEFYTTWGLPYPRGRGEPVNTYSKSEEVFGASGGASLYRTSLFEGLGLFDEKFFAYYEDTDISFRAQLAGWKIYYTPGASVTHRQGATSKKMVRGFTVYQTFKNLPMLFWKNVPARLLIPIGSRFFFAYLLILGKALLSKNFWPAAKGVFAYISLIPHTFRQRAAIQQSRTVSDAYIHSIIITDLPPDQTGIRRLRKLFIRK